MFYTNIRNSHIDTIVFARTGSIHLITSGFTHCFSPLCSKRNPHQVRSISAFIMSPCSRSTRGETAPARTIAAWVYKEKSWTCMRIEDFTIRSRILPSEAGSYWNFTLKVNLQSWDIWGWSSRRPATRLILSGIMVNSWSKQLQAYGYSPSSNSRAQSQFDGNRLCT